MPRKWCKSYIRTYLNNRPDTTAGERYQAIRCRMATQAPYPAVPTSGTAGGILLQKANYRRQESVTPCSSHQYGQLSPIYALLILNPVTKPHKTT
ncbi:hypothetical protein ABQ49_003928 [Salmonella enterica subsp. enterica serovar Amsterdam]|nr:hypothetical protein [Salmonella enterica]EDO2470198.1 hypothetical protein [Salmonella enterica subsp. enterica serovar Amsterdam var. 15+,34+]EDU2670102.1 hypothetical protein [Salmonella enterica subsp. enterica serovar Amsterdam]EDU5874818.1 hypothetical protein [Salmonella enterica subsp. enterica]EBA4530232.1 hypothetical protein [Salmonella enterica]